jgi:PAS domain S-box-containing protein
MVQRTKLIDLHCHSNFSDGLLRPSELADLLQASGVTVAALTDHDTIDQQQLFHEELKRREIGYISGLEMSVQYGEEEVHLLAYGFDPNNMELRNTLLTIRQAREPGTQTIADSLRNLSVTTQKSEGQTIELRYGRISFEDAVSLIHRAGGLTFLAHPFQFREGIEDLNAEIGTMKSLGLDGIEAIYKSYSLADRQLLLDLAYKHELLVSAGSDFHDPNHAGSVGIEMPLDLWSHFRRAVQPFSVESVQAERHAIPEPLKSNERHFKRRHFILHIIFPTLLALLLFVLAIFGILLPTFERTLLDRKREMIRELVAAAWGVLAEAEAEERAGRMSREEAQALARSRIESMRYGREGKDYFWLQDMHPRIIMHPYRKDLNGEDVSNFRDPRGVRIFVEFAALVRSRHEGYIEYVWQWKDDPQRLVPKESYIRGFEPWGWVIGTGIYLEDVMSEIDRIERRLVYTSIGISSIVALLLFYVMHESFGLERVRSKAESLLREWTHRYRTVVEATSEGTIMVLSGRIRYANPMMLRMLGYTSDDLLLLDIMELLPAEESNEEIWAEIERLNRGEELEGGIGGVMLRADGTQFGCIISLRRIELGSKNGYLLLVREDRLSSDDNGAEAMLRREQLVDAIDALPIGILRVLPLRGGIVINANQVARSILQSRDGTGNTLTLSELFLDEHEYDLFQQELEQKKQAQRILPLGKQIISFQGVYSKGNDDTDYFIDCLIEDITERTKREQDREVVTERLQASLLFLHETVRHLAHRAVLCDVNTTIRRAASIMTSNSVDAILVATEAGDPLGIVTDSAIRTFISNDKIDLNAPAYKIMIAPLITVQEDTRVYEALLRMEEENVRQLIVMSDSGSILGLIQSNELLKFHNYGPSIITKEIERSSTPEEVIDSCKKTPQLAITLLESGTQPDNITRLNTSICDTTTERFIELAIERLGTPPTAFAFIALGSQGRFEQTLSTDQDNAIIYHAGNSEIKEEVVQRYFVELGEAVCGWLEKSGYPACKGGIMARNPQWCQSLEVWKRYFREWIDRAEPQQLLEMSIFFDLRLIFGEARLINELRRDFQNALQSSPEFYPHFASNALLFKPPMRLFGRILSGGSGSDGAGRIELKEAMMPIVNFARLYALRYGLEETHTASRIRLLAEREFISAATRNNTIEAYDFLLRLRLRHQAEMIGLGQSPDNSINQRRLTHSEQLLLKQAFTQIEAIQEKIQRDFLGGMLT